MENLQPIFRKFYENFIILLRFLQKSGGASASRPDRLRGTWLSAFHDVAYREVTLSEKKKSGAARAAPR